MPTLHHQKYYSFISIFLKFILTIYESKIDFLQIITIR